MSEEGAAVADSSKSPSTTNDVSAPENQTNGGGDTSYHPTPFPFEAMDSFIINTLLKQGERGGVIRRIFANPAYLRIIKHVCASNRQILPVLASAIPPEEMSKWSPNSDSTTDVIVQWVEFLCDFFVVKPALLQTSPCMCALFSTLRNSNVTVLRGDNRATLSPMDIYMDLFQMSVVASQQTFWNAYKTQQETEKAVAQKMHQEAENHRLGVSQKTQTTATMNGIEEVDPQPPAPKPTPPIAQSKSAVSMDVVEEVEPQPPVSKPTPPITQSKQATASMDVEEVEPQPSVPKPAPKPIVAQAPKQTAAKKTSPAAAKAPAPKITGGKKATASVPASAKTPTPAPAKTPASPVSAKLTIKKAGTATTTPSKAPTTTTTPSTIDPSHLALLEKAIEKGHKRVCGAWLAQFYMMIRSTPTDQTSKKHFQPVLAEKIKAATQSTYEKFSAEMKSLMVNQHQEDYHPTIAALMKDTRAQLAEVIKKEPNFGAIYGHNVLSMPQIKEISRIVIEKCRDILLESETEQDPPKQKAAARPPPSTQWLGKHPKVAKNTEDQVPSTPMENEEDGEGDDEEEEDGEPVSEEIEEEEEDGNEED